MKTVNTFMTPLETVIMTLSQVSWKNPWQAICAVAPELLHQNITPSVSKMDWLYSRTDYLISYDLLSQVSQLKILPLHWDKHAYSFSAWHDALLRWDKRVYSFSAWHDTIIIRTIAVSQVSQRKILPLHWDKHVYSFSAWHDALFAQSHSKWHKIHYTSKNTITPGGHMRWHDTIW